MSGKINYTNRLPQVQSQNVIPVYSEADMGTPVGGVVTLLPATTYMIMVNDLVTTLRYDFAGTNTFLPAIIESDQKFANRFISLGSGDSLFFNSDPFNPSGLEIRKQSLYRLRIRVSRFCNSSCKGFDHP